MPCKVSKPRRQLYPFSRSTALAKAAGSNTRTRHLTTAPPYARKKQNIPSLKKPANQIVQNPSSAISPPPPAAKAPKGNLSNRSSQMDGHGLEEEIDAARAHKAVKQASTSFFLDFRKRRHLKTSLWTRSCWFLLDVAFHGINLNPFVVFIEIGFSKGCERI